MTLAAVGAAAAVAAAAVSCAGESPQATKPAHESASAPTGPAPHTTTRAAPPTSPDGLDPPRTAAETAAVLTRVERALRADDTDGARRLASGREQQLAYGALSQHPEWFGEVVAAVPADLRAVVTANRDAAAALTSPDLGAPPPSLPDWTILAPRPASVLLGYYKEAEAASGVRWEYLAAIHFVETRMGRIHGNSTAGAQGPMQFIPSTWAAYGNGGDVNDDHDAIMAAGRYLAARGGTSDIDRALFSYNPSTHYVDAIKLYASVLMADARAYDGYYAWQVYVTTSAGTVRLPEGWTNP
jgi:hypothetical protein